jgi:hypothetical protein
LEHEFTHKIKHILNDHFGPLATDIYEKSPLIQYINKKTVSAMRGSKARASFANLYAVYVLVEDYLNRSFDKRGGYSDYEGAQFTNLMTRQRQLPFGSKLQNHALNHRMNEEFKKFFPEVEYVPILRDDETRRYWINERLLKISVSGKIYNIATMIKQVIEQYMRTKRSAFNKFIKTCENLKLIGRQGIHSAEDFIIALLAPNVDARIFEIVSYAILKYYYHDQVIYVGFDVESIQKENLKLYKTGRTNANDGGIDFVMRPLGRFFQVTESIDAKKYFLDIEKIERYPISFVIKSEEPVDVLKERLKQGAEKRYSVSVIVNKYMECIEEIINIPVLKDRFKEAIKEGYLAQILGEIVTQSRVEFNYPE